MDASLLTVLFIGLGNPGSDYAKNRHNSGFLVIDKIAEEYIFPKKSVSFKKISPLVEVLPFFYENYRIILAKPLTYMNLSGRAVRFLSDFYKVHTENIYVFHDDIDLEFGRIKIKKGGGNGGHNGLRSIDGLVGKEYWRIRIGVGRPAEKTMVASYVLHDFKKNELEEITTIAEKVSKNIFVLLSEPKKLEQELNEK